MPGDFCFKAALEFAKVFLPPEIVDFLFSRQAKGGRKVAWDRWQLTGLLRHCIGPKTSGVCQKSESSVGLIRMSVRTAFDLQHKGLTDR